MSKRESDLFLEGPPSKFSRDGGEDGGGGRAGRVRKKSAKVLEMEEFESAEKTATSSKKGKTPKFTSPPVVDLPKEPSSIAASKKVKPASARAISAGLLPLEGNPKSSKVSFKLEPDLAVSPPPVVKSIKITPPVAKTVVPVVINAVDPTSHDDEKSVIKHLLNSPSAGSKHVNTPKTGKSVAPSSKSEPLESAPKVKKVCKKTSSDEKSIKVSKKPQSDEKVKVKKVKVKKEKIKAEMFSESDDMSASESDILEEDSHTSRLKMTIFKSSNPSVAQVSMNIASSPEVETKKTKKKVKKFAKQEVMSDSFSADASQGTLSGMGSDSDVDIKIETKKSAPPKKAKKKEKLILDAISAAQVIGIPQETAAMQTVSSLSPPVVQKVKEKKKKTKSMSPVLSGEDPSDVVEKDEISFEDEFMEEESSLVIAETEKKKKKTVLKKKASSGKEKSSSPKEKIAKEKRAPTAYMLFCNQYRTQVVNENPGIAFADISKKLGELWQVLSNKQKLNWRKKAQKKAMKAKGSNFISTGKAGKVAQGGGVPQTVGPPYEQRSIDHQTHRLQSQKSPRPGQEDTPQSPTQGTFSYEPIDCAAHLKLLGESLSIIGMRLQEHKGMIAVQGSLSVLLDSLLCACGPLLCLTQQVPGMDGCLPSVHAATLDSVAYIMPGL